MIKGLVRCFECKQHYVKHRLIMYTVHYKSGKNHFVCWHCLFTVLLREGN